MTDRAGWGILGTGKIARIFAKDLAESRLGRLAAVGSRDGARASAFAEEFGAERWHAGYAELIADPAVQYVYVATPHTTHCELVLAAAAAGKHVLCEKPLSVTEGQARQMVAAASDAGTFLMEAFAFRCHPQTRMLLDVIRAGEIGELRSVDAAFGYDAGPAPANYLHRADLAGGSILDVGCYTVALSRQLAGEAVGRPFRDPDVVRGAGLLHEQRGVDLDATAILWCADGFAARVSCSIRTNLVSTVLITGSEGTISLPAPWLPGKHGGSPAIVVRRRGEEPRELPVDTSQPLYAIEADTVVERSRAGLLEAREVSWADTIGNMRTLDRWRAELGLRYEVASETPHTLQAVG